MSEAWNASTCTLPVTKAVLKSVEEQKNNSKNQQPTHMFCVFGLKLNQTASQMQNPPPWLQSLNWRSLAAESSSTEDKNESSETTARFVKAALRVRSALCISSQLNKWLTEGYLETLAGGHAAAPLWFSLTSTAPLIRVDESSRARGVIKWSEWRAADSSSKR